MSIESDFYFIILTKPKANSAKSVLWVVLTFALTQNK